MSAIEAILIGRHGLVFPKTTVNSPICPRPLKQHRVHADSETYAVLKEKMRAKEDYKMFEKFWLNFITKKLTKMYASSEKSNELL